MKRFTSRTKVVRVVATWLVQIFSLAILTHSAVACVGSQTTPPIAPEPPSSRSDDGVATEDSVFEGRRGLVFAAGAVAIAARDGNNNICLALGGLDGAAGLIRSGLIGDAGQTMDAVWGHPGSIDPTWLLKSYAAMNGKVGAATELSLLLGCLGYEGLSPFEEFVSISRQLADVGVRSNFSPSPEVHIYAKTGLVGRIAREDFELTEIQFQRAGATERAAPAMVKGIRTGGARVLTLEGREIGYRVPLSDLLEIRLFSIHELRALDMLNGSDIEYIFDGRGLIEFENQAMTLNMPYIDERSKLDLTPMFASAGFAFADGRPAPQLAGLLDRQYRLSDGTSCRVSGITIESRFGLALEDEIKGRPLQDAVDTGAQRQVDVNHPFVYAIKSTKEGRIEVVGVYQVPSKLD